MSIFFAIDLFKTPVFLAVERQTKTSSNLGLFFSIGLIIFLTISFSQSDVFYKSFPKVVTLDIINEKRPLVNLNGFFAVSVLDKEGKAYIDPHIFEIHITNFFMELDSSGEGFKFAKNDTKTMHPCTEADFPDNHQSKELSFENNFCLDNPSFELEGYWNEKLVNYIEIGLLLCENKTSEGQCKSFEEIQEFLGTKYLNIYFTSHNTDTSNYLDPVTSIILQEYIQIDLTLRKTLMIFLKNLDLTTDDAFLFSSDKLIREAVFDKKEIDIYLAENIDDPMPCSCIFYTSLKTQKIQRVYQKIAAALADLGGMANFLMIFGFIITSLEKDLDLKKKVMNSLYSFQNLDKLKKKKKKNQKSKPKKNLKNTEINKKNSQMKKIILELPEEKFQIKQKDEDFEESIFKIGKNPTKKNQKLENSLFCNKEEKYFSETENNSVKILKSGQTKGLKKVKSFDLETGVIKSNEWFLDKKPQKVVEFEPITSCLALISPNYLPPKILLSNENLQFSNESNENIDEVKATSHYLGSEDRTINKGRNSMFSKINSNLSTSFKKLKMRIMNKGDKIENVEKFNENMKNSSQIKFSLFENLKLILKQMFKKKLTKKEKLFLQGEKIYEKEIDILYILKKLQEIEKMKIILFNNQQLTLFNLMEKPLIYLENGDGTNEDSPSRDF